MSFTLRQLAVFDAVARMNNVSRAAQSLHMTQSAASMAIQALEQDLGHELFIRTGKSLTLSGHGKTLQPMARSVLLASEEIGRAVGRGSPAEELVIGASPTIANFMLDEIIPTYLSQHPGVHVVLSTLTAADVIQKVDELALDIGLTELVTTRTNLRHIRWRDDKYVVFCSPEHPLAKAGPVDCAELGRYSWCLQRRWADTRREFTYSLLTRVESMDIVLEVDSIDVLKAAVAANTGLGCLPRPCVAREIQLGTLVEVPVTDLSLRIPFLIITHKGVQLSAAREEFIRCAMQMV